MSVLMRLLSTRTNPSPRYIFLATAIGWLLIALGMTLLLLRMQVITVATSDFTQDYVAAQALRADLSIYADFSRDGPNIQALRARRSYEAPPPVSNNHPPFNALLFIPLTFLRYDVAILLWSVLSLLLYVWINRIILHELRIDLAGHWMALLAGLALFWYPFQTHIALGQLSLLVIACIIGCWVLLRRQRPLLAGVLLGVACLIKLFPGLIIGYLLLRHRRAAAAALVTLAIGGLLTLLIVGRDDLLRYAEQVAPLNAVHDGLSPINISLNGVVGRLFVDGPWVRPLAVAPRLASLLVGLGSLGLLALLIRQIWRMPPTQRGDDVAFALACLAMLLLSPISWQHIFPLLALPCGLLLRDLRLRPDRRMLVLALLALALVSLPDIEIARALAQHYAPYRMPWSAALLFLAPTAALLLLWWMVGARARAVTDE